MIKIKDVRESLLEQEIPGTLNVLREISPQIESLGFDIEIRDTDHRTDSLRFYPVRKGDFDAEKQKKAESILTEAIEHTCSYCGTHHNITQYPCHPDDWSVSYILCPDCYRKSLPYIPPISLGMLKDSSGRDVKDGDIIMGIMKDRRIFWGLIVAKQSTFRECDSKQTWSKDDFILLHNPHCFPTPLFWAINFIIIDNCGTDHNPYDNYDPHYQKYDKWCREINKPNKWWLWKRKKIDFGEFEEILKKSIPIDN